jgi:hypothetical protein
MKWGPSDFTGTEIEGRLTVILRGHEVLGSIRSARAVNDYYSRVRERERERKRRETLFSPRTRRRPVLVLAPTAVAHFKTRLLGVASLDKACKPFLYASSGIRVSESR